MRNKLLGFIALTIALIALLLSMIVEKRNESYLCYLDSKIDEDIEVRSELNMIIMLDFINRMESESIEISNKNISDFVNKYKNKALYNEYKYNIPASITLAQAILESGAGQARLAKEANNFFGVKLHKRHKGGYILVDDDAKNEKFCKYDSAEESFKDHAQVLKKDRYKKLFDLDKKDYKGWAKGLSECGYATNPKYANLIIDIIEKHNLNKI